MKILVTGAAGFIGYHLCQYLLSQNHQVVGLDNLNSYYDVNLKFDRLEELGIIKHQAIKRKSISKSKLHQEKMQFIRLNLEDRKELPELFKLFNFDMVCNLAAQAGVRYSINNPEAYIDSNINGFLNVLECCRNYKIKKLVYASSSSVYGNSRSIPFNECDNVNHPISLYAATKKSNELMAHSYSHLFGIETIGLRFFTVYGPWGRPDMALYLFVDAILNKKPIKVFNNGNLSRDFTYIDDIISGISSVIENDSKESKKYHIYNIGNSKPVKLMNFINEIENATNNKALIKMLPMQAGDVETTFANITKLKKQYDYLPQTSIKVGVNNFVEWYKGYYNLKD